MKPKGTQLNEVQTLSEMSDADLMLEVDAIRILDTAFRQSKLAQRYELKVSSSELLDALFEECKVDLADRIPLMQLYFEQQYPSKKSIVAGKYDDAYCKFELKRIAQRGADLTKL